MKKYMKVIICFSFIILSLIFVSCGQKKNNVAEKVTLDKTMLGEVEFANSEKVKIKQDDESVVVSGEIESMSAAQKSEFGVNDVTHVIVLKFMFDKERTIDSFKIEGNVTKVYSTNDKDANYVGSISDLLDSDTSEDAYCNLILSANTKSYTLTSKYSDGTVSTIVLKIEANLVTAKAE